MHPAHPPFPPATLPHLCVPPERRIETRLPVHLGRHVPLQPPRVLAAQVAVEVLPEDAAHAIQSDGIHARVEEASKVHKFEVVLVVLVVLT